MNGAQHILKFMQPSALRCSATAAVAPFIGTATILYTPVSPATYSDVALGSEATFFFPVIASVAKQSREMSAYTPVWSRDCHVAALLAMTLSEVIPTTMKNTPINPITHLPAKGVGLAIDDFTPATHLITVQWYQPGMATNHTAQLCRSCFEQWLEDTGRLSYYSEPEEDNYSHLQTSGTNDTDSYWQYADYQTQTSDIKAFILAEIRAQQELS